MKYPLTQVAKGADCIVYDLAGKYVVKIGNFTRLQVLFLETLPAYRPEIVFYRRGMYIPGLLRMADVLIMKRYIPVLTDESTDMEKILAHRLAWMMALELEKFHDFHWFDSHGYNICYDADRQDFVIIDA